MHLRLCILIALIFTFSTQADARPRHHKHHAAQKHYYRVAKTPLAASRTIILDVAARPAYLPQNSRPEPSYPMGRGHIAPVRSYDFAEGIVGHPPGCPGRAFCGCGTSVKVFGHPVRDLYLARNWFKFPRAAAASGMVAVRSGHVFYIQSVNGDGTVVAYDPNSGNHQTRVHTVSLRGYTVVDPNGNPTTYSARKIRLAHR